MVLYLLLPIIEAEPEKPKDDGVANCRSTTIPCDKDFGSIGKQAAWDKNVKTYCILANMTYPEWRNHRLTEIQNG